MGSFDSKQWNEKVFQKYLDKVPNEKLNLLIKSGAVKVNQSLASRLVDGVGGNYIEEPIKGNLDGTAINYDGVNNITASNRKTFKQGKIVVGRAKAWTEKDFSTDLTGEEFLPLNSMAGEVGEYYEGVDQNTILSILAGIFSMSSTAGASFVTKHTLDITSDTVNTVGAGTLNKAITKACGDHKAKFSVAFMHSDVAVGLETLQLLDYLKYTDANGIQRDLTIGQWNGRLVLIDDDAPVDGNGNYTTYLLGDGAIEYANCGAKVPNEMDRDPATNGGVTTLYTRQRKLFAPKYISFDKSNLTSDSPTDTELSTGANWDIANDGNSTNPTYINDKLIPIARIISKV